MVQKKSLHLFALQLRHQHKSVVSLSKEMVDARLQTSASTFASGANMERKTQTHTVSPPPPPVMCVFMTMLLIVSFSKAGSLPPTADAEMIPGNLFMVALREHNRGY